MAEILGYVSNGVTSEITSLKDQLNWSNDRLSDAYKQIEGLNNTCNKLGEEATCYKMRSFELEQENKKLKNEVDELSTELELEKAGIKTELDQIKTELTAERKLRNQIQNEINKVKSLLFIGSSSILFVACVIAYSLLV